MEYYSGIEEFKGGNQVQKILAALFAVLLYAGSVQAYEIRFEEAALVDGQAIPHDYGSVPGLIDVSYTAFGHTAPFFSFSLNFRSSGFSGHPGAYTEDGSATAYIFLTPEPGYRVRLNSFFLGALGDEARSTSYLVNDDATWPTVDIFSGPITVGADGLWVYPGWTSADEIEIGFGPTAFGVGINYINFDVLPVPEPAAWLLLLAGLLTAIAARRHAA